MTETKLQRWDKAILARLGVAATFGPPNWLVSEEWKGHDDNGKDIEPFEDAVERVRARYFPSAPLSAPKVCKNCGEEWAGRGLECWGCQKKRQRKLRESQ